MEPLSVDGLIWLQIPEIRLETTAMCNSQWSAVLRGIKTTQFLERACHGMARDVPKFCQNATRQQALLKEWTLPCQSPAIGCIVTTHPR